MKIIIGLFGLLLLVLILAIGSQILIKNTIFSFGATSKVTINRQTFKATVAKTLKEKQIGLSEKKSLKPGEGMLFVFEAPDYYPFWMKNMKIPLDIIFIKDDRIVTLYKNVQPPVNDTSNLPLLRPSEPINKVLEITAGLSDKYMIKEGDIVKID